MPASAIARGEGRSPLHDAARVAARQQRADGQAEFVDHVGREQGAEQRRPSLTVDATQPPLHQGGHHGGRVEARCTAGDHVGDLRQRLVSRRRFGGEDDRAHGRLARTRLISGRGRATLRRSRTPAAAAARGRPGPRRRRVEHHGAVPFGLHGSGCDEHDVAQGAKQVEDAAVGVAPEAPRLSLHRRRTVDACHEVGPQPGLARPSGVVIGESGVIQGPCDIRQNRGDLDRRRFCALRHVRGSRGRRTGRRVGQDRPCCPAGSHPGWPR